MLSTTQQGMMSQIAGEPGMISALLQIIAADHIDSCVTSNRTWYHLIQAFSFIKRDAPVLLCVAQKPRPVVLRPRSRR